VALPGCLALAVVAVFLPPTARLSAEVPPFPLKAEDVFNVELATDPRLSPDGKHVVYVRQFADVTTDKGYSNLWIVGTDGKDHRPLTTGKQSDSSPRWSPDGTRLAYVSDREAKPQIVVRWLDGGQTVTVTNLESAPSGIAWSPDGTQLSFVSIVKGKPPSIAALPSPPAGATWAEPPRVFDRLVYRFNGPGYLAYGFNQVFVVPAEGGTPRQVTSGDFHHGAPVSGQGAETAWTPDGHLVVVANRRVDWEYEPFDTEIYDVDPKDASIKALTDRRGPDRAPAVSPDGRRIAYLGYDDRYQGYQVTRLYVMDRDGSHPRALTMGFDRDPSSLAWSPDGTGNYFAYDEEGDTKLGFVGLEGRVRTLARQLGSTLSSYSGGASLSVAPSGTVAFTHATPSRPGDIAVLTRASPQPGVITSVNDDLLSQRKLGPVEEFWFESSLDKRKIQGWIVKPPDFDPARKYRLLLEIHGGPFANYGDRFDLEKQVWAGLGYVVVYVNPRGSTSYGEEFGNLIHHAYPGDDFFDLESGVDAVIGRGYVDPDQLFVGGGSGGGVLTAWVIGRTTRYRAAVAYYPVINWTSWTLSSDIPIIGAKYWFPGNPWDYQDQYDKRSLLSVVKNVKTPTLVITGEEDYRTPISESEQYYTALVRVPGEPHGLRRRPSHHMAKILDIAGWFERYRKK